MILEEHSLFLIDIHIIIVILPRVVTSISPSRSSYLLPVFHGLCWVEEELRVDFQILMSETHQSRAFGLGEEEFRSDPRR